MKKILFFLSAIILGLVMHSCKKNNGDGPPMITNVRALDTTKRDSFFTRAIPGTEIVVQGINLNDVQAVFFNDTAASFNPVYNTSSTLIVVIPSTSQTAATNPKVPSILKVVTSHGTATYSFTLYLPPPAITSITFDNSGTLVTINGYNFQGIQKIVFPTPNKDTALSYTVNKTFTQITAVIPKGTALQDSLRVYCLFGVGSYAYPPPMAITSVSNENGAAGTTITINGTNFINISKVTFPGGLLGSNIKAISVNQISVTVPTGITTTDSLRITGALGSAVAPQLYASYVTSPSPGYLSNFENQNSGDNTGFVGWTAGYANAATTTTTYPGGNGASAVLIQSSAMSANAGSATQGNAGFLQLNDLPWVANTADSVSKYSMKFEIYVAKPWSAGEIWINTGDWYNWRFYAARYAPWETAPNGIFQPTGWVTVTIPLKQFITGNQFYQKTWSTAGAPANTFDDYLNAKDAASNSPARRSLAFMIMNDQAKAVPANTINIAIDNVRIVKGQ